MSMECSREEKKYCSYLWPGLFPLHHPNQTCRLQRYSVWTLQPQLLEGKEDLSAHCHRCWRKKTWWIVCLVGWRQQWSLRWSHLSDLAGRFAKNLWGEMMQFLFCVTSHFPVTEKMGGWAQIHGLTGRKKHTLMCVFYFFIDKTLKVDTYLYNKNDYRYHF